MRAKSLNDLLFFLKEVQNQYRKKTIITGNFFAEDIEKEKFDIFPPSENETYKIFYSSFK